jgi:MerR family mercuric resistance operon transcriptional regulator
MKTLTTSQLAQAADVNLETIRYYERRGLIPEPPRRSSGYRQYSEDYIGRIRSIKQAQDLGFSLDEVAELFALRVDPDTA